MSNLRKVLICDDSQDFLVLLKFFLNKSFPKFKVYSCSDGFEAMELAKKHDFELFISDFSMGAAGADGVSLFENIRKKQIQAPFILVSAHEKEEFAHHLFKRDFYFYRKPLDFKDIRRLIRKLIK